MTVAVIMEWSITITVICRLTIAAVITATVLTVAVIVVIIACVVIKTTGSGKAPSKA